MVGTILSITFMLVALYLVLTHASDFQAATQSLQSLYTSSVQALQGR